MKKQFFIILLIISIILSFIVTCNTDPSEDHSFKSSSEDEPPILYIASKDSNKVTFFNAETGSYINGTYYNSSFTTGMGPYGIKNFLIDLLQ